MRPPGFPRRALAEGLAAFALVFAGLLGACAGAALLLVATGTALAAGEWTDFWVYVVGPVLGAAHGAGAYQAIRAPAST